MHQHGINSHLILNIYLYIYLHILHKSQRLNIKLCFIGIPVGNNWKTNFYEKIHPYIADCSCC